MFAQWDPFQLEMALVVTRVSLKKKKQDTTFITLMQQGTGGLWQADQE